MTGWRDETLARLGDEQFDVVVIGGGITGAGVALDAAARGLRTAIVEKGDWASGTSSKSSKLVHGGLRYLQQRDFRLVYESLRERRRLLQNAPHLVSVMPFLIPVFGKQGAVSKTVAKAYNSALWMYDLTGGWRIGKLHKRISAEETMRHMGGLSGAKVAAGFLYYDAAGDDARVTLTIVRTACDYGATALNYAPVHALTKTAGGAVSGVQLAQGLSVRAKCVVNATGVWSQQILELDGDVSHRIRPAKGVHITVPFEKVRADIAGVVPVPRDRRSIFVVPALEVGRSGVPDRIYVGTTDTDYDGPLDDPQCTPTDVRYLLDALNTWLEHPLSEEDVLGTWAGLRPLLSEARSARTADLSRRHAVVRSRSGLVSILGGKWTTYRQMAEDTVDEVVAVLGERRRRCPTRRLPLRGASGASELREPGAGTRHGTTDATMAHLAGRHGGEALAVLALTKVDPGLARPLVTGLPYLEAEVVYASRHEMACCVTDVLARRTRALIYDREGAAAAAVRTAEMMGAELGWSETEREKSLDEFLTVVTAERASSAGARDADPGA